MIPKILILYDILFIYVIFKCNDIKLSVIIKIPQNQAFFIFKQLI